MNDASVTSQMEAQCVGKSFWHPTASRLQAEQILKPKPPGSFVIRRSSKVGCLALSHKLPNHSFGHALVMFDGSGYTLEQANCTYSRIEQLIKSMELRMDEDKKAIPRPSHVLDGKLVLFQAEVLCTYAAVLPGEINAKRGDYLNVIGTDGPHYICECNGAGGKFPIGLSKKIAGTEKGVPKELLAAAEAKAFKPGVESLPPSHQMAIESNYARATPQMPPNYLPESAAAGLNRALGASNGSGPGTPGAGPPGMSPLARSASQLSPAPSPSPGPRPSSDIHNNIRRSNELPPTQHSPAAVARPTSMYANGPQTPPVPRTAQAPPPMQRSASMAPPAVQPLLPPAQPRPQSVPQPLATGPPASPQPSMPRPASPQAGRPALARQPTRSSGLKADAATARPPDAPQPQRAPSRVLTLPMPAPLQPSLPSPMPSPGLAPQPSPLPSPVPPLVHQASAGSFESNGSAGGATPMPAPAPVPAAPAPAAAAAAVVDPKRRCQVCDVKAAVAKVTMSSGMQLKMCHDCIEKERERKKQQGGGGAADASTAAPPAAAPAALPPPIQKQPSPAFALPPPTRLPAPMAAAAAVDEWHAQAAPPEPEPEPEADWSGMPPPPPVFDAEPNGEPPPAFDEPAPPAFEDDPPPPDFDAAAAGAQDDGWGQPAEQDEWGQQGDEWGAAPAPPEAEDWQDDNNAAADQQGWNDVDASFSNMVSEFDNLEF